MQKLIIILMTVLATGCAKRQFMAQDEVRLQTMDYVMQAGILEQQGFNRQAIEVYKKALKLDKESSFLHLMIAQNYYDLENYTLAIYYARKAVKLEPDNSDNRLVLGNAYMMAKELELSLEQYQAAVKLKPDNPDIAITAAGLYEALDRRDSAIIIMENIARRDGDPDFMMQLGAMLMRNKQNELAKEIYRQVIGLDSANVRAWVSLAAVYELSHQPDSALYFYNVAARTEPDNLSIQKHVFNLLLSVKQYELATKQAEEIIKKEPANANLRLQLARLLYHQQDIQNAEKHFRTYLESDSNNTEALYTVARINFQNKQYPTALQYFKKTTHLLPKMPEGWISLGNCFLASGQPDSAAVSFQNARGLGINQTEDYLMGAGYSLLEKYQEALPYFQNLYQKNKKDTTLLFNLAAAYERSENFDDAVVIFKKLLELNPKSHIALNYLGYMYAERGQNLEEAGSMIDRALEAEPDNAFYIDSKGWVFYKMGQLEKARESLEKAVNILPNDPTLRDHLGDVYLSLDLKQEAIEQWQKALEIDPGKEKIREKIDAAK